MTKYERTLREYNCPKELVKFVSFMAIDKRYVSHGAFTRDIEGAVVYQREPNTGVFEEQDAVHAINWRFDDFNRYDSADRFVSKKLTPEGVQNVLHFLDTSFQDRKLSDALMQQVYPVE